MEKIVSEDAVRRAFKAIDEKEGADWTRRPTAARIVRGLSADRSSESAKVVPDRREGRVRSAQDRSAFARSSVEERQCVVSFLAIPSHTASRSYGK